MYGICLFEHFFIGFEPLIGDSYQSERYYSDPHQGDADPKHWARYSGPALKTMQIFRTYEAGRVVVPDGLGVAEGLHHRIGLHNLEDNRFKNQATYIILSLSREG